MTHSALSPAVMLATSMHAQPGVYAVLLGSGVSTGAGILTGWGVVEDLVQRVAAAAHPDDPDSQALAAENPRLWWDQHQAGDLGYSSLLQALAPTASARQGLLAGYFEATEDDADEGAKQPSDAHRALAKLVKRGLVRVILTTNFDRLTERALEAEGVSPQVIARPEAVAGMAPLAHSAATVIKLHGDYLDLGSRNTPEELGNYPAEWQTLLAQVFDEYGLLICGWSADWDTGLVAALETTPSRRYPLYWDSRSSKGETARRLLSGRSGATVTSSSADDLFTHVLASVEALDRLAEPPLTTAMATVRLKRYLPDPVRRIDLHDLVMGQVSRVAQCVGRQAAAPSATSYELMDPVFEDYLESTKPLLALLAEGIRHDRDGTHDHLWLEVLQSLIDVRRAPPTGITYHEFVIAAQHYPAILALFTMGLVALRHRRDGLLLQLLREVKWREPYQRDLIPAFDALHTYRLLSPDVVNALPRWNGQRWLYPPSHLIRSDLKEVVRDQIPADDFQERFDDLEFRIGLIQYSCSQHRHPSSGEFVDEWRWAGEGPPRAERKIRDESVGAPDRWPWWQVLKSPELLDEILTGYRAILAKYQRW